MSGWHCEVAQVTNRLTWSSAVGLEQREDRPSHKLARAQAIQSTVRRFSARQAAALLAFAPLVPLSTPFLPQRSDPPPPAPLLPTAPLHTPPRTSPGWQTGHERRRKHASQALQQRLVRSKHAEGLSPAKFGRSLRRRPQSSQSKEYGQVELLSHRISNMSSQTRRMCHASSIHLAPVKPARPANSHTTWTP
jgi:hypothetical protein